MTQDETWQYRYDEVVAFIKKNQRNPSKYVDEERGRYCNWLRHNRKVYHGGKMKEERRELFARLLEMMELYRRKNQYE